MIQMDLFIKQKHTDLEDKLYGYGAGEGWGEEQIGRLDLDTHTSIVKIDSQQKVKSLSCVQLCDPMDCSLPGSSIHGIFQARIMEWVSISFSRGS